MSFDIFPIVKKKGKATCAIGNCVYSHITDSNNKSYLD